MLSLRTARLFVASADAGTLTAAAERLHVSQPAATKSLAQLEADLGGALFERAGRKLVLTRMGEALLPRARALLQQAEDLKSEAERWRSGEDGVLSVGAGPSVTYRLLPEAVARFYRAGRTVQLTIRAGAANALLDQVRRGALDLVAADMGEAEHDPALRVHALPEEGVAAWCAPATQPSGTLHRSGFLWRRPPRRTVWPASPCLGAGTAGSGLRRFHRAGAGVRGV